MKLKKSNVWYDVEHVNARCPHCGWMTESHAAQMEGDVVWCKHCGKKFELGKQK